jgi:hypothetical protein
MPEITPAEIEAEARTLLRERIRRMPWHQGLSPDERARRIEEDVERYWPTLVEEAARRLVDCFHPDPET